MLPASEYLMPYLIANAIALGVVVVAYLWPRLAKILFSLLFLCSGIFCFILYILRPEAYIEVFGAAAVLQIYRRFIYGFFVQNFTVMVMLIVAGQIVIGILLGARGLLYRLGIIAGMIFLIALVPLGPASAFPATMLLAVGLFIMLDKSRMK